MAKRSQKTLQMAQFALFAALVLLLAFTPGIGYIPLGVIKATTVHIPVIIGSILLGWKYGAALGGLFGLTSFINNSFISPSITSFVFTPLYSVGDFHGGFWSIIICFVPRILVGVVPYFVYLGLKKLFKSKKGTDTISLIVAGVAGSLTNTILVMSMIYTFFGDQYIKATGSALNGAFEILMAVLAIVATNGTIEAIVAAILSCAVCKVLFVVKRQHNN